MPNTSTAQRMNPAAQNRLANSAVHIETAQPASRIVLRGTAKGAASYTKSLGLTLPKKAGQTTNADDKYALWIGPDEWFIYDEAEPEKSLMPKLANQEFATVDVSHRNMAFVVTGQTPSATENVINAGCPRDLSLKAFPVATASRTILGKAEVILHRIAENSFRIECWRSFAPYVWDYLQEGAKDAHI